MPLDDLPLARAEVDRAAHLRLRPELLAELVADPRTRVHLVHEGRVAVHGERLVELGPDALAAHTAPGVDDHPLARTDPAPGRWLFLGADDAGAHVALRFPAQDRPDLPDGAEWCSLRDVGADLDGAQAGLATAAVALDFWHRSHRHCPRCGTATRAAAGGWLAICPSDLSEHHPRTDPAVIMAVVDDADRLLLGRAAHWPSGRFSTLAGFVEPGESLENAIRREVLEETAVVVGPVEYRGSQPWPFPASLMLGFRGRALSTAITVDAVEVVDARWFTRAELAAVVADGSVLPPGRASIARALIEEWFGGPLGR